MGLIPFIKWAKDTIFVTNMTSQPYDDAYQAAHLDALNRGVKTTRIVRIGKVVHPDDRHAHDWLQAFYDPVTGKPHKNYKQFPYPQDDHARLDYIIIDSIYVIEVRWSPKQGRQDIFFTDNSRSRAKFKETSWQYHIEQLGLKKIQSLAQFKKLLDDAESAN